MKTWQYGEYLHATDLNQNFVTVNSGAVPVTAFGATGNGTSDDTVAINNALTSGATHLLIPPGTYITTNALTIPQDVALEGIGKPTIHYRGTAGSIGVVQTGGTGARLSNVTIDGGNTNSPKTPFASWGLYVAHDQFLGENIDIVNYRQRGAYVTASQGSLRHCRIPVINGPGVAIYGASLFTLDDIDFTNATNVAANFGVHVSNGTNRCTFRNLRCKNDNSAGTTTRSLELLGMKYDCFGNKVEGCHAEGTGDNGISITGYMNSIVGNVCRGNYHAGITIYGKWNSVTGNQLWNNNQRYPIDSTSFANLLVSPAFGGEAAHNTITGNTCIDDQATPTAEAGVKLQNNAYNKWVTGNTFTSSNRYCYVDSTVPGSGLSAGVFQVYAALSITTAVAGATPPTWTSGTQSDGTIAWTYLFTAAVTNLNAHDNYVNGNVMDGHRVSDQVTDSTGNAQTYVERDGIKISSSLANTFVSIKTHNADPVGGGIIGNAGDMLLRKGGGAGTAAYVKIGGDGTSQSWQPTFVRIHGALANRSNALVANGLQGVFFFDETNNKPTWVWWTDSSNNGWVEGVTRDFGATTARPTLTSTDTGRFFYDTTLNRPIWWTGSAWIKADGTAA